MLVTALVGTTVPAALAHAVEPPLAVRPFPGAILPLTGASTFKFSEATAQAPTSAPGDGRTQESSPSPPEPSASGWERSFTLKAGVGYKDNLTLAPEPRESSPFAASSLEAFVLRSSENHQLMGLATFEDYRYWQGRTVDHEDLGIAQGEWRQFWPNDWQTALGLEGIYIDQVVDLSVTETNREALPVRGWTLTARPGTRHELSAQTWLALELPATRQLYDGSLDDYWEYGPKAVVGHLLGERIETSLSYAFTHRDYDTEPGRDANGDVVTNTVRSVSQHDVTGAWKHYWDAARRWRTATKLGYRHSSDNFDGYFDYERYSVSQEIRFRTELWELSAEARYAHYRYPVQTVSDTDSSKRSRSEVTVAVRGERQVAKHVRLYAQYDYERTESNAAFDEYTVNTVSGGVAVEF
jgi:hypothetical protein